MDGFTIIDGIVAVIVILSAVLAYSRGFVREALSIGGWILAAIAVPRLNVTRHKAYRTTLRSDLKSLSNAQELYFNVHFTYSSDLSALQAPQSEGVTVTVNEANNGGWAATATHAGLTSEQCGIFYGDADASGASPATTPGVTTCTN